MATKAAEIEVEESALEFIIRLAVAKKYTGAKVIEYVESRRTRMLRHQVDRLTEAEIEWISVLRLWEKWPVVSGDQPFPIKRPADIEQQAFVPRGFLPICYRCKKDPSQPCPMVYEVQCANNEAHPPYKVRYGFENFEGTACPECFTMERKVAEDATAMIMEHLKQKSPSMKVNSRYKAHQLVEVNSSVKVKETDNSIITKLDQESKNESFDKWLKSKKQSNIVKEKDAETSEDILFAQGYKSEHFNNWVGSAKQMLPELENKMMEVQVTGSYKAGDDVKKVLVAHNDMPVESHAEIKVKAERLGQWYKVSWDPTQETMSAKEAKSAKVITPIKEVKTVKEGDSEWVWMEEAEDWDFV